MKKLITTFALLASVVAQADYMLWSVSDDQMSDEILAEVDTVRVGWVTKNGDQPCWTGTALYQYDLGGDEIKSTTVQYESGDEYIVKFDEVKDLTDSYSFYIELLNDSGSVIARTGTESSHTYTTYAQLKNGNYVTTGDIGSVPTVNVWHGGQFTSVVPEPSSMALLALGAGLVGLRRKLKKGKKAKKETRA